MEASPSSSNHPVTDAEIFSVLREVRAAHPIRGYVKPDAEYGGTLDTIQLVLRNVPRGGRILDFGAGGADKTAALARLGYEMHAFDDLCDPWHLSNDNWRKIISFAESFGVHYHRAVAGEPFPYQPDSFDMVILDNVMEHLHDSPKGLLEELRKLIKPGGVLFISVPNAGNLRKRIAVLLGRTNMPRFDYFYWKDGPWRGHVREYVRDDMEKLARYLNLTPVELGGFHSLIGTIPRKYRRPWRALTAVFPNWSDSWKLVGRKEPGSRPMSEPPDENGIRSILQFYEG
jgi:SAM-dependent methyltransferase